MKKIFRSILYAILLFLAIALGLLIYDGIIFLLGLLVGVNVAKLIFFIIIFVLTCIDLYKEIR